MLRHEIKKETEIGKKVKDYLNNGALVPDQVVIDMIKGNLDR